MSDTRERTLEREIAAQRLSAVFAAPQNAYAIHYALQRLRQRHNDPSPPVAAVSLRNLGTGALHVLSIKAEADRAGITLSNKTSAADLLRLEYCLLFGVEDFFAAHRDCLFVHWYMRDQRYGFEAIETRYRTVASQVLADLQGERAVAAAGPFGYGGRFAPPAINVPEQNRIDLANIVRRLHGIGSVGLRALAEANRLSLAELIDGKDEPMAFAEGNYARLAWSSATKSRLISELAVLAWQGNIVAPQRPPVTHEKPLRVFISYRRQDSQAEANWLHEILSEQLGDDNVFIDTDDIPPGRDFESALREAIDGCDVFLAVMGPDWANAKDAQGFSRLASEQDYVRQEIRTALAREVLVVPVLIEGTPMPAALDLPADLLPLRRRQAVTLRVREFRKDVEQLLAQIRTSIRPSPAKVAAFSAARG